LSQGRRLEDRRYGDDQSYEDRSSEDRFRKHQPFEGRSSLERGARRDPDFAPPRAGTDNHDGLRAADDFSFLRLPAGDDYAVAPRHALADEEDYDHGDHRESSQRHSEYGRQHAEYADEYHEDEYEQDDSREYGTHRDDPDDGAPVLKRRRSAKVVIVVL